MMLNRLKGYAYDVVLLLAVAGLRRSSSTRRALVVRTDEIGDYMLWRRFISEYAGAALLQDTELHLCGNPAWKSLLEVEYPGLFSKIHWLDKKRFKKSLWYRFCFLRRIFRENYSLVINPLFSRAKRVDDAVVKAAAAPQTIGMVKNNENCASYELDSDRGLYTALFEFEQKPVFEFTRNKLFSEYLTGQKSVITDTCFNTSLVKASLPVSFPSGYFVVFPGSGNRQRIWPAAYFAAVAKGIFAQGGGTAVVCGGPGDREFADNFLGVYDCPVVDIVGSTSLQELLLVLQHARCLISVDTGSVHLAAAVGCPVLGIFNGSQYGRFAPYPVSAAPAFYAVYPDQVEADIQAGKVADYEYVVKVSYADVRPEKVLEYAEKLFNR